MQYQGKTFRNDTVELDGNEFEGCDIHHCTLVYRGGKVPLLANSTVADCQFTFEGSALNTMILLRLLYHGGFQPVVESFLNDIRTL
jgi:hypothetical protein